MFFVVLFSFLPALSPSSFFALTRVGCCLHLLLVFALSFDTRLKNLFLDYNAPIWWIIVYYNTTICHYPSGLLE
jgi:hypothetical protein